MTAKAGLIFGSFGEVAVLVSLKLIQVFRLDYWLFLSRHCLTFIPAMLISERGLSAPY